MYFVGIALKELGHQVHFLTSHHDPNHCFKETQDGSLNVTVAGAWFPRSIFGRCYALCAYLRMIFSVLYLIFRAPVDGELGDYDVIFCDQISAPIPFIRWFSHFRNHRTPKIIFYCHHPDMLLTKRESTLKRIYRAPIDWFEERTTGWADVVLVNSNYTGGVFRDTFKSLNDIPLQVLYPSSNFAAFDRKLDASVDLNISKDVSAIFLSINRYERKKNLELAIEALSNLQKRFTGKVHLVLAGGYDERVDENREYFQELVKFAEDHQVSPIISFLKSPSDAQKHLLLHNCTAVIYTPENEHFGIVPIEAMYMNRAVIACNSGGPLETVINEETGFLCDSNADSFAKAMANFVEDKSLAREMGSNGHDHVKKNFSYSTFKKQISVILAKLVD